MKFKTNLAAIFKALGFTDKAKNGKLTDEDWKTIFDSYKKEYGTDLTTDLQDAQRLQEMEQQHSQILAVLKTDENQEEKGDSAHETSNVDLVTMVTKLVESNKNLETQIEKMTADPVQDKPDEVIVSGLEINGPGNSQTHFLGIEHDNFALTHRWNQIAINPAYATLNPVNEEEHADPFYKATMRFGRSLATRYAYLKDNRMLDPQRLAAGEFGFDTSRLPDAGLGDQYMIRRQDALIARILTLRTVTDLFPVRYGIQDREMITNAYFTEISQAYQKGEIWKGDMKLEPEFGYVDDAMVKTLFGTMKEIERQYIGYLNTDGSDPIKWSMIEFALLNLYKKMQTEQNKRRIMGIYVKPESGVAGSYLNASTGIVYTLIRYIHENKLLPHADNAYATYDNTDMLESVQEFVEDIQTSLVEDQDLGDKCIYLNFNHQPWWIKNIRKVYGKDTDFSGPDSYLYKVPDTQVQIKWLPNLGQLPLILIQTPGNLQFLEFIAGEMFGVKIKEDMELVKAWSTWKEGTSAGYVGPTFRTPEALKENAYQLQEIYMNKPAKQLAKDATEITANPKETFWYITAENTQDTVLTDIKNARKGVAYIVECGSTTHATEIKKTGSFATIGSDWKPEAEGDYIMVILNSQNTFLELERQVNGVREINKELQPNVPGAR